MPLRYWQSDNRTFAVVLPHLRAAQKGNWPDHTPVARKLYGSLGDLQHLHRGDWSFHLTNKKKKKKMMKIGKGFDLPTLALQGGHSDHSPPTWCLSVDMKGEGGAGRRGEAENGGGGDSSCCALHGVFGLSHHSNLTY